MEQKLILLSASEFLEIYTGKIMDCTDAPTVVQEFRENDPVSYTGKDLPELFNITGIIINPVPVNGMLICYFSGLGEYHLKAENLQLFDDRATIFRKG